MLKNVFLLFIGLCGCVSCVSTKRYNRLAFEKVCLEGVSSQYLQDMARQDERIAKMEGDRLKLLQDTMRLYLDTRNLQKELVDMREKSRLETGRVLRRLNDNQRESAARLQYISDIEQILKQYEESLFEVRDELVRNMNGHKGVTVAQENGRVNVDIKEGTLFGKDPYSISRDGNLIVKKMLPLLHTYPDMNVVVTAYLDSAAVKQSKSWNDRARKAVAVSNLFLQDTTLGPTRVSVSVNGGSAGPVRRTMFDKEKPKDVNGIQIVFVPDLNMLYDIIRENK